MTFTEEVKGELIRIIDEDQCCRQAALAAIVRHSGTLQLSRSQGLGLNIPTQNPGVARLILKLIKEHQPEARVFIRRRSAFRKNHMYLIFAPQADKVLTVIGLWDVETNSVRFEGMQLSSECCRRAYLRGAFLVAGTVNNPNSSSYHLEIVSEYALQSDFVSLTMQSCDLKPKIVRRKELYMVYLKEADQIVDFLNLIGAHSGLLKVEEARVRKDMRNKVNRLVNAETANLNKTVVAAWRQVECIRFIDQKIGILALPKSLQELAEMRARYPDASLQELGEYLSPPLSKSAVNHRLRKLEALEAKMGYVSS
jgi:DNA-binding protein WhiA